MSRGRAGTVKFVLVKCIVYLFSLQVYVKQKMMQRFKSNTLKACAIDKIVLLVTVLRWWLKGILLTVLQWWLKGILLTMLHKGTKAPYALISPTARELLKGEYGVPCKSISARVLWANTQAQGALGVLDNSGSLGPGPRFCRRYYRQTRLLIRVLPSCST